MQVKLLIPTFILCIGTLLLIMIMPISIGESGGTEGTEMHASSGGSFPWNAIHMIAIEEDHIKVEDEFNVTICENVKHKDDTWTPAGHIFGELQGIRWDDEPEPTITISIDDFENYKESRWNLTFYVFGEYTNASNATRYAFRELTIIYPNNPPVAVVWFSEEGNWSWTNLSEKDDVTVLLEDTWNCTLWFNASHSWDPNGDSVTEWEWNIESHGGFGCGLKTGNNESWSFDAGRSYFFSVQAVDERGARSDSLNFTIRIRRAEPRPDLTVGEINYENKNNNKANYEVGDIIIVQPKIKNEGANDTTIAFNVLIEYSTDNGASYQELTRMGINDSISSGNFKLLTYNWDTGRFAIGQYKIRVTADFENSVNETMEDNNLNSTNSISLEHGGHVHPNLAFDGVWAERTQIFPNYEINITISVRNIGDGDARYVDIHYFLDGEHQYFRTIDSILAGYNETIHFTFSSDSKGSFNVQFSAHDDGREVAQSQTLTIDVTDYSIPIAIIRWISPNPAAKGETIMFHGNVSGDDLMRSYHWRSSKDGFLASKKSFSSSTLSSGTHRIYFKVRDDQGFWSDEVSMELKISKKKDDGSLPGFSIMAALSMVVVTLLIKRYGGNNQKSDDVRKGKS